MSDSSNHSKQVVSINDETEVKSGVIIAEDSVKPKTIESGIAR